MAEARYDDNLHFLLRAETEQLTSSCSLRVKNTLYSYSFPDLA